MSDSSNITETFCNGSDDLSYYWVCGICNDKVQFLTINEFFRHKTDKHHRAKNCSENGAKYPNCSATIFDNDFDDDDDLPLSQIIANLDNIYKVRKSKKKKSRDQLIKTPDPDVQTKTDTVPEALCSDEIICKEANNFECKSESSNVFYDDFGSGGVDESDDFFESSYQENIKAEEDDEKPINPPKYICKICFEEFDSRSSLSKHKKLHLNPETGNYHCETCGKQCPKYDNFTRHLSIHSTNRQKEFKCEICSSAFYCMADLKRHHSLHSEEKPFKCEHCKEGFTRQDALLSHMAKHTGIPYKKYTCNVCGKISNSPSALAMHSKNHTNKTVFCSEPGCTFSCHLLSQLRQHVRIHSGEKPFQCAQCGRCFARSNDMKNHILNIHHRFRPFKCSDCPKQFTLFSSLRAHKLSHSDVKPYLCAGCGKRFNHTSSLRKHAIAVHGNNSSEEKSEVIRTYEVLADGKLVETTSDGAAVLPIAIHIPHISVSLEEGYSQPFVIPTLHITSPQLIKNELQ